MIEVVAPAGVVVRLPEDCSVETIGHVLGAIYVLDGTTNWRREPQKNVRLTLCPTD
jgi:hypothetical protein